MVACEMHCIRIHEYFTGTIRLCAVHHELWNYDEKPFEVKT